MRTYSLSRFSFSTTFFAFCIIFLISFTISCSSKNLVQWEEQSYSYADGNANKFVLFAEGKWVLEYHPVEPMNSSSGLYSGGKFERIVVSPHMAKELVTLFEKCAKDMNSEIATRVKGSGLVVIQGNAEKRIILAPNASSKMDLENRLREFFTKGLSEEKRNENE